jgi:hypothetical protein
LSWWTAGLVSGLQIDTVAKINLDQSNPGRTDRTRLSSSGRSLAFSSPVSVAAIGPAQRLCHAGGMGDQDGLARRTRRIR